MKKMILIIAAIVICGYSFGQVKVLSNGKVGVGAFNPTYNLQVAGNVLVGNFGGNSSPIVQAGLIIDMDIESYFQFGGGHLSVQYAGYSNIYGYQNNQLRLGKSDNMLNSLWAYNISYQNLYQTSDIRLKENIRLCSSFLSKLKEVKTYNYNYKDEFFRDFTPEQRKKAQKTEFGFIAQELQKIFPDLVHKDDSTGMLSINYVSMIPILTSAINELQQEKESQQNMIDNMQQELNALRQALMSCCKTNQTKSLQEEGSNPTQQFELTDPAKANVEEMKVYQNAPNPFNATTTIQCYIPQTIQKAQLCVYDMLGVQVKCLPVSGRGTIDIQIEAGQLSSGVYTYFLIGDAQTSDAKQMILTR